MARIKYKPKGEVEVITNILEERKVLKPGVVVLDEDGDVYTWMGICHCCNDEMWKKVNSQYNGYTMLPEATTGSNMLCAVCNYRVNTVVITPLYKQKYKFIE